MHASCLSRLTTLAGALLAAFAAGADHPATISQGEFAALVRTGAAPLVLDVRSPPEYAAGHVPGARSVPLRTFAATLDALAADRNETIVVYCESGPRAVAARAALRLAGHEHVMLLEGHMRKWRESGLSLHNNN